MNVSPHGSQPPLKTDWSSNKNLLKQMICWSIWRIMDQSLHWQMLIYCSAKYAIHPLAIFSGEFGIWNWKTYSEKRRGSKCPVVHWPQHLFHEKGENWLLWPLYHIVRLRWPYKLHSVHESNTHKSYVNKTVFCFCFYNWNSQRNDFFCIIINRCLCYVLSENAWSSDRRWNWWRSHFYF